MHKWAMLAALFSAAFVVAATADDAQLDNVFFPFNNAVTMLGNAPESYEGKAALLKEFGYDGLEGNGYETFADFRAALKKHGLAMPCNYLPIDLEPDKPAYDPRIKDIIQASDRGDLLWLHIHSTAYKDDQEAGDKRAVAVLRELADFAAPHGVDLAVYLHRGFFCETVEHGVRLAKMVDRPNFGTTLNLCHLLKVEGDQGIPEKMKLALPHLKAVSICGADAGDTQGLTWVELIQPLGDGSFDTYGFVRDLKKLGYDGPIGLQCYNIKGDCRAVLEKSMATWREYQKRFAAESR